MRSKEEIEQLAEKLYVEPLNKQGEQRTHTPKSGGMYGFKKFKKYFTLGYTQCQEDMQKDVEYWQGESDHWHQQAMEMSKYKYTEEDMMKAFEYGKTLQPFDCFEDFINSLNKQD
jgi:hypothetical protein